MQWFLAKIVYRILCGDGRHRAQFDEQLRLISAYDADDAFLKATGIGQAEAETFFNNRQQAVEWQFVNVSELYRMQDLTDGAEVYSRINEVEDAEGYIDFVHHKAQGLQQGTHRLLNLL